MATWEVETDTGETTIEADEAMVGESQILYFYKTVRSDKPYATEKHVQVAVVRNWLMVARQDADSAGE